jgi:3-oxoacyl-[acyl-carrier-protein] synthase-3
MVGVASCLPQEQRSSRAVEDMVAAASPGLAIPRGLVETMTGIRYRRVAAEGVNASDLAAGAARSVLEKTGTDPSEVGLLVFGSASQDLAEPATANIVQEKVGTSCPVFDVKNACNSFLNGVQVAEALILGGACRTALVTVGEVPSRCVKWAVADRDDFKLSFPGYTFGDAGAAALLTLSTDERGIYHRSFQTVSRFWDIGTLPGGGSMHPRGEEWTYFRGDGTTLKDAFVQVGPGLLHEALRATETTFDDYHRFLVHQVAMPFFRIFLRESGVPGDRVTLTLPGLGNMAAATLPVGFAQAEERGEIGPGDHVMWIGLAGGISIGVLCMCY